LAIEDAALRCRILPVAHRLSYDSPMDTKHGDDNAASDSASGLGRDATSNADFRQAMADVRPHAGKDRALPARRSPPPRPLQREADERAVLQELLIGPFDPDAIESGDTLAYRANGIQDSVWRRLRRGAFRIGAELDLHGLNRYAAQAEVSIFLADCQDRGIRAVRIIHGKGRGSPNSGPVIKTLLDGWLRRRRDVLAFASARACDGGTGAVYVLLRLA
jgi:DNA-nicking Smr family endonuclease